MNLLTTANLLSRLYNGNGLTLDELIKLKGGLQEQLNYVSQLVELQKRRG